MLVLADWVQKKTTAAGLKHFVKPDPKCPLYLQIVTSHSDPIAFFHHLWYFRGCFSVVTLRLFEGNHRVVTCLLSPPLKNKLVDKLKVFVPKNTLLYSCLRYNKKQKKIALQIKQNSRKDLEGIHLTNCLMHRKHSFQKSRVETSANVAESQVYHEVSHGSETFSTSHTVPLHT